ncbi:hypothetical protein [Marivita sp. S2033]|uniref:hypothetical protein n=1 Tax=Marivita sp. S2033 TaxID=3373187 RepID=UPI0039828CDC
MPDHPPVLADSVTKLDTSAAGRVIVTGSHGGVYAAYLARRAGSRAAIFNDAGVGMGNAGISGLSWLNEQGMAAAAIDYTSADIGNAEQAFAQGRISHVNQTAERVGVTPGMACAQAATRLAAADMPHAPCPDITESRDVIRPKGALCKLVLIDSAALVRPEDAGQVIITGSHGALFGDDPSNALRVDALLALFNDAGGGIGTTRLPALDQRGVAAVTVAASSARIGEAHSSWKDGVISAANASASRFGAKVGMPARDLVHSALTAPQ